MEFLPGDIISYHYFNNGQYLAQVVEAGNAGLQVIPLYDLVEEIELPYTTSIIKFENTTNLITLGNHKLPLDIVREHYPEYLI